jgi:hypothetical protein
MVTVTPMNGFNGTVAFSCPDFTTGSCTFSPATVVPAGAAITTTVTITSTTQSSALHRGSGPLFPEATLALAACALLFRKRRGLQLLLPAMAVLMVFGGLMACGNDSGTKNKTPVTSTVTVNASSGAVSQFQTITLTVN